MDEKETYKIDITREQMLKFKRLYEFFREQLPFIPDEISKLYIDILKAFHYGCFKHNLINSKFKYNDITEYICPKCQPKRYKELKSKYKEHELF